MMDSNRRSYRGPAALVSEAKSFIAWILALLIVALAANTGAKLVAGQTSHLTSHLPLTSNCDPFIGADGGGNTVPGAAVPFGFANPSPDTLRHDTSGYDSRQPIIGFSQTHVSGTGGASKYGNFRITPEVGELRIRNLASAKKDELAMPGYYAVTLTGPDARADARANVGVELTATRLVAVHRYTFPKSTESHLLLDVSSMVSSGGDQRQRAVDCTARIVGPNQVEGTGKFRGGWNPTPYTLHFFAEFSRPFAAHGAWSGEASQLGATSAQGGERTGLYLTFDTTLEATVEVKIGLSFISAEQARANVEREVGKKTFAEVRRNAAALWEEALSRILVEGGTDEQRRIFYTALYRSHYMPHDLSGENVWWKSDEPHYEDYYCLWDTFRTLHPLLTLIQPDRQRDMVRSLVDTYRHTGWIPDARVAGANGLTQGGSNGDVLVADALVKGLRGIDYEIAYAALRKDAEEESPRPVFEGREISEYKRLGYLSLQKERSASRTLEYAYDDFCIAEVARRLGKVTDAAKYLKRSQNWTNLWDVDTRTIRPREANGKWMQPYDPLNIYSLDSARFSWWGAPYYEGSGYQYSTYVPHDVQGLINRLGGDAPFVAWLDAFFDNITGSGQDNSGLYSQGNEPDLLAAFLYIHAGRADRTQETLRRILAKKYRLGRAGLPGNDDAGTMSSWYVWNAVGLYPNAGQPYYYIGSPLFRRAQINVGNGRVFTIDAPNASAINKYVQRATLNGQTLGRAWLSHTEVTRGGRLVLWMRDKPSMWGVRRRPPSVSREP
ncbi:MAG TPA: GH92 family glycosyl hydrolase [Pyrinomonadaceae bacterium]